MTLILKTGLRSDVMSTTRKVLSEARANYVERREQHEAHKKYLEADMEKTLRGIERCDLAIKDLTETLDKLV